MSSLFPQHPPDLPLCKRYVFSDSLILIANGDSYHEFLKLLLTTWRFAQALIANGLPVRGGVAVGEVYVNQQSGVVVGKAVTDAYRLETKQNWVGVAIDGSFIHAYPEFHEALRLTDNIYHYLFFAYDVPLKGGSNLRAHTVNWRYNLVVEKGTRSLFQKTGDAAIDEKIDNTLDYAQAVVRGGHYMSPPGCQREIAPYWCGESDPPFDHGDEL